MEERSLSHNMCISLVQLIYNPNDDPMGVEICKGKGKFNPRADHEGPKGQTGYISDLFFKFGARWD